MNNRDAWLEEAASVADEVARAAANVALSAKPSPQAVIDADAMARGARMVAAAIRARKEGGAAFCWLEVAGHGSDYVRIQASMPPYDAIAAAEDWERIADTIGGRARVVSAAGGIVWRGR